MISMKRADSADPGPMRQPDHWKQDDCSKEETPVGEGEDDQTSDQLNDRPRWVVDQTEDELRDTAGIVTEHARHAAGSQVMDSLQRKSNDVVEYFSTDVDGEELRRLRRQPTPAEADRHGGEGDDDHGDRDRDEQSTRIGEIP